MRSDDAGGEAGNWNFGGRRRYPTPRRVEQGAKISQGSRNLTLFGPGREAEISRTRVQIRRHGVRSEQPKSRLPLGISDCAEGGALSCDLAGQEGNPDPSIVAQEFEIPAQESEIPGNPTPLMATPMRAGAGNRNSSGGTGNLMPARTGRETEISPGAVEFRRHGGGSRKPKPP